MRRQRAWGVMLVVLALLPALGFRSASVTSHFEYVVSSYDGPATLFVYDIDRGHQLVRSVTFNDLPGEVAGAAASAATHRLYISAQGQTGAGRVLAYDLVRNQVLWVRTYQPAVDALCVTPDGRHLYVSSGENSPTNYFFVVDPFTGGVRKTITVAPSPHNAVCSLDSSRAYLTATTSPYLSIVRTADDAVLRRVGPFGEGIRPFSVNGRQTLAFANVNYFLGFEVADMISGRRLYRLPVPGFPSDGQITPSHGVGITPNEREAWVADSAHGYLHVFDITGLPGRAPSNVADIALGRKPQWVTFSLDGRFAYSAGRVISTSTRKVVASTARSYNMLEIDFRDGVPVRAASRHGLGYVTG